MARGTISAEIKDDTIKKHKEKGDWQIHFENYFFKSIKSVSDFHCSIYHINQDLPKDTSFNAMNFAFVAFQVVQA